MGLERRQNMFTNCRHDLPNRLLYNKLYTCKVIMTIGKTGLRFFSVLTGFGGSDRIYLVRVRQAAPTRDERKTEFPRAMIGFFQDRVIMGNYSRKIAILVLLALVAGAAPAFFAPRAEAREPRAGIALPENYALGGEPGEDPHLKTIPKIYITQESEPLGADGYEGPVLLDECSINLESSREGSGRGLGSRVNLAWRMLLRTWLWQLHR